MGRSDSAQLIKTLKQTELWFSTVLLMEWLRVLFLVGVLDTDESIRHYWARVAQRRSCGRPCWRQRRCSGLGPISRHTPAVGPILILLLKLCHTQPSEPNEGWELTSGQKRLSHGSATRNRAAPPARTQWPCGMAPYHLKAVRLH